MAIAIQGTATSNTGTSSATVNKPTGVVDDDILVLLVTSNGNALTTLSGWTLVFNGSTANTGKKASVFWKRAASEGASYTITPGAAGTTEALLSAYSGVDTTTALDATSVTATAVTNITYASITTGNANALHVICLIDWTNVTGTSTPTNYTNDGTSTTRCKIFTRTIATATTVSGVTSTSGGGDGYQVGIALKAAAAADTLMGQACL